MLELMVLECCSCLTESDTTYLGISQVKFIAISLSLKVANSLLLTPIARWLCMLAGQSFPVIFTDFQYHKLSLLRVESQCFNEAGQLLWRVKCMERLHGC